MPSIPVVHERLTRRLPNAKTLAAIAATWIASKSASAQSQYRDVDGGRPLRVEDAIAAPRHALELQLAPLRLERLDGGISRWQVEPRLSYGVLPRTELKLRAPIAYREAGASPRSGLVGIGVGAFHALTVESEHLPAIALEGETIFPAAGSLTVKSTYALRGIATRSFGSWRAHGNIVYGTYRIPLPKASAPNQPTIPDSPCAVAPATDLTNGAFAGPLSQPVTRCALPSAATARSSSSAQFVVFPTERGGERMLAGLGLDRTFPLHSTLIAADVFAERFTGLNRPVDWTAEVGVRRQLTVRSVIDAAVGRRFRGAVKSWTFGFGVTTTFSSRLLMPGARP